MKILKLNKLNNYFESYFPSFTVEHIKIEDKENNRFTDIVLEVTRSSKGMKFYLKHEKGYPSEQKGYIEKSITTKWLSNELPKV